MKRLKQGVLKGFRLRFANLASKNMEYLSWCNFLGGLSSAQRKEIAQAGIKQQSTVSTD